MNHWHSPVAGSIEEVLSKRGYNTANWETPFIDPTIEKARFRQTVSRNADVYPEILVWLRDKSLWRIQVRNYVFVGVEFGEAQVIVDEPEILSVSSKEVKKAVRMCIEVGLDVLLGPSESAHERLEFLLKFRERFSNGIEAPREFWPPILLGQLEEK